jgi:hypothetical protein
MHALNLVPLVVLLSYVSHVACQNVNAVFNVKAGTTAGGCGAYDVAGWFQDSLTLINTAETAATATDENSREYLQTFFTIGPRGSTTKVVSRFSRANTSGEPW